MLYRDFTVREITSELRGGNSLNNFSTIPVQRNLTFRLALVIAPRSEGLFGRWVMDVNANRERFDEIRFSPIFDEWRWSARAILGGIQQDESAAIAAGEHAEPTTQRNLFERPGLRNLEGDRIRLSGRAAFVEQAIEVAGVRRSAASFEGREVHFGAALSKYRLRYQQTKANNSDAGHEHVTGIGF
jgi:hypothetical protein